MTRIEEFGWRGEVVPGIGRIVSSHGDYYHLVANEADGEILARKKKSVFKYRRGLERQAAANTLNVQRENVNGELQTPITGDFVRFRYNAQGDSLITEVLPRFSHFERKDPTARRQSQTLAVNFDTLFVMMSLNENFSLPRLRRYLTLAADMGEAETVLVLTKCDLKSAADLAVLSDLAVRQLRISSLTGEGLDQVLEYVRPRRTVAFIGSSGVGKSTLINTLAGEEWQATQAIQEWSGKGRHTTTSRELIRLPSGAMVIDTPGIREIGRLDEEEHLQVKGESSHRWRK